MEDTEESIHVIHVSVPNGQTDVPEETTPNYRKTTEQEEEKLQEVPQETKNPQTLEKSKEKEEEKQDVPQEETKNPPTITMENKEQDEGKPQVANGKKRKKNSATRRKSDSAIIKGTPKPAVPVRPPFFCSRGRKKNTFRASLSKMYDVQQRQLKVFRKKAAKGRWGDIHYDHFDWFMFPIEDGSQSQYNVLEKDVEELKSNSDWHKGYLEGVELVSRAWGWDVKKGVNVAPMEDGMGWTNWDVRLAKIVRSLWIFGEKEYFESMQKFAWFIAPKGGLYYGFTCLDEILYMTL